VNEDLQHPGSLLEPLVLVPTGCSQSRLARLLGFNQPQPVNELVKGKRGITPKMALLLERLTKGAYPAEFWLLAQLRWDIARARDSISPSRLALVQSLELKADQDALRNHQAEPLLRLAGSLK